MLVYFPSKHGLDLIPDDVKNDEDEESGEDFTEDIAAVPAQDDDYDGEEDEEDKPKKKTALKSVKEDKPKAASRKRVTKKASMVIDVCVLSIHSVITSRMRMVMRR